MAALGKILELWRYPVSSISGERLETFETVPLGVPGDRRFGLVETDTGLPARPEQDKRWHAALALHGRIDARGVTQLRGPDFDWIDVLAPELPARLAAHFGFPVHVAPYENRSTVPDHAGSWALGRYEPHQLHLLTTASIARLKALHPLGDPDRRRFRPNMLIDMPEVEGQFPEAHWVGRVIRAGTVFMEYEAPTRRCGFTIIGPDRFDSDPNILRHIVRSNSHNMGIYCIVQQHGRISVGDDVRFD